ncbi:hypothetical protein ODV97_15345 [Enterococcus gallinarum]|nr:hypothetical protein [Enterococcus gallinarum]
MTARKAILLSVLLSIFAGYLPFINQVLTLQRTFVFLPFFIIGFYFPKNEMQFLQGTRIKKSVWFSCRLSTCLLRFSMG